MHSNDTDEPFVDRIYRIAGEVTLGMKCTVLVGRKTHWFDANGDPAGPWYYQIECERLDVITGKVGTGRGGKADLGEHMTDNELVQCIFGLYQSYWIHEARENFQWRGRRVFGPHISTEALWEVAKRVDVRSAQHVEDRG